MSLGLLIDPKIINSQPEGGSSTAWRTLVADLKSKDPKGDIELDRVFSDGIRFFLKRSLGSTHLEARVRETMLIVKTAIREEEFDPEALASAVRSIVQKQIAKHVERQTTNFDDPVERTVHLENVDLMAAILQGRPQKDRDALVGFYVHRHTRKEICAKMQLDEKEFELMRERVKLSFEQAIARRATDNPSRY